MGPECQRQLTHRRAPQAPCGRPAFAKKQLFLLPRDPHLQCNARPPLPLRATKGPLVAPGEGWGEGGRVPQ